MNNSPKFTQDANKARDLLVALIFCNDIIPGMELVTWEFSDGNGNTIWLDPLHVAALAEDGYLMAERGMYGQVRYFFTAKLCSKVMYFEQYVGWLSQIDEFLFSHGLPAVTGDASGGMLHMMFFIDLFTPEEAAIRLFDHLYPHIGA